MTPFQKDITNLIEELVGKIMDLICYFFGHLWGKWKNNDYPLNSGQHRRCKRCDYFDYDRQRARGKL